MDDRLNSALQRVGRSWGHNNFLQVPVLSDLHAETKRTVYELREHFSTMARIKGRSWYAKKLLAFQHFPNRCVASETLIQLSHIRIEQTRDRIVRTKNILAFY